MTVGLLSFASVSSPSGIATINGFGLQDYPFKNFMKLLGSIQANNGTYAYPPILDANGYPTTAPASNFFGTISAPTSYTGNWKIYGTGQTKIQLQCGVNLSFTAGGNPSGFGSIAGTVLTITATGSWVIEFTPATPVSQFQVTSDSTGTFSGFTNLALCRSSAPYTGDKAAIDSGILTQMFNVDFTNALAALNPLTLRVIDWNSPDSGANISKFANRTPVAALSYATTRWDPNCIATNGASGMATTDVADAYSITTYPNDTGAWVDGETIQVQISATNTTTTPTFNVGSRAAKTIINLDGTAMGTFGTSMPINTLATFTYDLALDKVLYTPGGIAGNAVPYEVTCALANLLNKNLSEAIPTHYDLASVNSWAAVFRDNLNSNLTFKAAYSNEMWNSAAGFEQTGWAQVYGAALGFPNNNNRPVYGTYSLRICQFMPAVASTWIANGRSRSTLKCLLEFQAFGPSGAGGATNVYRLQSADLAPSGTHTGIGNATYVTVTGGADFTQFPNRAVDRIDRFRYATYWSGAQCANTSGNYSNAGGTGLTTGHPASGPGSAINGLVGAADAFASGDTANAIAWLDWDVSVGTNNGTAGAQTTSVLAANIYPAWETGAGLYDGARPSGFSNIGNECYEGGLESIGPTVAECGTLGINVKYGNTITNGAISAKGTIQLALEGYKNSALFSARVQQQFTEFMGTSPGRGSNHSVAPAYYRFGNSFGAGQWAMEITDLYGGFFQSYNGFQAFQ